MDPVETASDKGLHPHCRSAIASMLVIPCRDGRLMRNYFPGREVWGSRHRPHPRTNIWKFSRMTSQPQSFVQLSAALTGVSPITLHGTGMTNTYLRKIESIVPGPLLERLFGTFAGATRDSASD